ncbi:hypothetical protein ONZ45_g12532 [Pleurotus djamor]|nr:hypothetical protein ONZ45_g12532 [Pleurotus djamor]
MVVHNYIPSPKDDDGFCKDYLRIPSGLVDVANKITSTSRTLRDSTNSKFRQPPIISTLNRLSEEIHSVYAKDQERIVFVEVNAPLAHHPDNYEDAPPQIVAIPSGIYKQLKNQESPIPWHHVYSVVEDLQVVDTTTDAASCGTALALLLQARPDLVCLYGLAAPNGANRPSGSGVYGYEIRCCNPGGMDSQLYSSDNLVPMAGYIHLLYKRIPRLFDPTITLSNADSVADAPLWDVRVDKDKVYKGCKVKKVGWPWNRMTWVVYTFDGNGMPIVIKDSYRQEGVFFYERELYGVVHGGEVDREGAEEGDTFEYKFNQDTPGFCLVEEVFDVEWRPGKPIMVGRQGYRVTKTRMVMLTTGDPLTKCSSVLGFVKVMFDAIQAHRYAFEHLNIMHRDISIGNILINPKEAREPRVLQSPNRPKFITEVLDVTKNCAPPLSRLIDLDGSAEYDASEVRTDRFEEALYEDHYLHGKGKYTKHIASHCGTPRFISRANCAKGKNVNEHPFKPMPQLEGRAAEVYETAYSREKHPLRFFADKEGKDATFHGGSAKLNRPSSPWLQHPRDDAESVFWVMLWFLLRAVPRHQPKDEESKSDDEEDLHNNWFLFLWNLIESHEISSSHDSRSPILLVPKDNWPKYLHHRLSFVGPLLFELSEQVRPDYRRLQPEPEPLHLHEAITRILLKYIVKWENEGCDVELDCSKERSTMGKWAERPKRKAESEPEKGRKRGRSH